MPPSLLHRPWRALALGTGAASLLLIFGLYVFSLRYFAREWLHTRWSRTNAYVVLYRAGEGTALSPMPAVLCDKVEKKSQQENPQEEGPAVVDGEATQVTELTLNAI